MLSIQHVVNSYSGLLAVKCFPSGGSWGIAGRKMHYSCFPLSLMYDSSFKPFREQKKVNLYIELYDQVRDNREVKTLPEDVFQFFNVLLMVFIYY